MTKCATQLHANPEKCGAASRNSNSSNIAKTRTQRSSTRPIENGTAGKCAKPPSRQMAVQRRAIVRAARHFMGHATPVQRSESAWRAQTTTRTEDHLGQFVADLAGQLVHPAVRRVLRKTKRELLMHSIGRPLCSSRLLNKMLAWQATNNAVGREILRTSVPEGPPMARRRYLHETRIRVGFGLGRDHSKRDRLASLRARCHTLPTENAMNEHGHIRNRGGTPNNAGLGGASRQSHPEEGRQ